MSSQSKDKKKEILSAAIKLFADYGFHGTPTSKIARMAGVANGTLFHYYNTKESLIISLYLDIKARMSQYTKEHAGYGTNVKEQFRGQYVQILLWSLANKAEFRFLQQFHSSPFAALVPAEEIQKHISKSCGQIEQAIKEKIIRPRDTALIITLFTSHTFGLHQYLINAKLTEQDQEKVINDSFDMLWGMIS